MALHPLTSGRMESEGTFPFESDGDAGRVAGEARRTLYVVRNLLTIPGRLRRAPRCAATLRPRALHAGLPIGGLRQLARRGQAPLALAVDDARPRAGRRVRDEARVHGDDARRDPLRGDEGRRPSPKGEDDPLHTWAGHRPRPARA